MTLFVLILAVLAALGGLAYLTLLGVRLFRQVKSLGRTVADAGERIAEAGAQLEEIAPRPDGRSGISPA